MGVQAAAPPPLSAKRDLHVPGWQVLSLSSLPVPRLPQQGWERVTKEGIVSQQEGKPAPKRREAAVLSFKLWTCLHSVQCLWHFSQEQNLIEVTFGSLPPRSACPYGDSPPCHLQLLSLQAATAKPKWLPGSSHPKTWTSAPKVRQQHRPSCRGWELQTVFFLVSFSYWEG